MASETGTDMEIDEDDGNLTPLLPDLVVLKSSPDEWDKKGYGEPESPIDDSKLEAWFEMCLDLQIRDGTSKPGSDYTHGSEYAIKPTVQGIKIDRNQNCSFIRTLRIEIFES
jgi:hypothetical protein